MVSALWLIPICFVFVYVIFQFWAKCMTLKIDLEFWQTKCKSEEIYARNIQHIFNGEPTEDYPGLPNSVFKRLKDKAESL